MLIQLIVGVTFILLGIFRDNIYLQLPVAASGMILLALIMTVIGAISYWLRGWAVTLVLVFSVWFTVYFAGQPMEYYHQAFGMRYDTKAEYSRQRLHALSSDKHYMEDVRYTQDILQNWLRRNRASTPQATKPKMVFICTTGGGLRAAVWTMYCLRHLDSLTNGDLMRRTMLITGASGGMLGAAYYRELYLRDQHNSTARRNDEQYIAQLAKDKLTPLIYSLIVND